MANIFEVRFETESQLGTKGRFSIPKSVVDILNIKESTQLIIETTSTKGVNSIISNIKSGCEIYGGLDDFFELGEFIVVKVTKIGK